MSAIPQPFLDSLPAKSDSSALYGGAELAATPFEVLDAQGIYLYDEEGRDYIDCASGTFDQPLGYAHPKILKALHEQVDAMAYLASPFLNEKTKELAAKLVEISPPNLTRVHLRDLSGSTAIEGAIKIAQVATGNRDIITLFGSHHGQTQLATDASGNAFRRELYPTHAPGMLHVPAPYCYRCFYRQKYPTCELLCVSRIRDIVRFASSGSVAAIVVEPVSGNGGNLVPPRDYFKELRKLCDEIGCLLIFDEVQTGLGRLGTMFAADYFGVQPHIMVLAKGLGGPVPRGAILLEEGLEKMPRYQHSFTGASSLVGTAAALATIEVLQSPGFLENTRRVGEWLGRQLTVLKFRFPFLGDVRGAGMMWGLEIVNAQGKADVALTNRICKLGFQHGLVLRSSRYGFGNVVKVRPPLITTEDQARELVRRLTALLEAL